MGFDGFSLEKRSLILALLREYVQFDLQRFNVRRFKQGDLGGVTYQAPDVGGGDTSFHVVAASNSGLWFEI